jgi:hypothetical protein
MEPIERSYTGQRHDVKSDQTVGMRFSGLDIAAGVRIVEAYVQFQVDERSEENQEFQG